jgi:hypothetical protein
LHWLGVSHRHNEQRKDEGTKADDDGKNPIRKIAAFRCGELPGLLLLGGPLFDLIEGLLGPLSGFWAPRKILLAKSLRI